MFCITGDEKIRSSLLGAFQELVVLRIMFGHTEVNLRFHTVGLGFQASNKSLYLLAIELSELVPLEHFFVFRDNGLRKTQDQLIFKNERQEKP